jgi:hypothetical protein
MTTSKFATIHGGLLARKGEAAPAVRHDHAHVSYSEGPPSAPDARLAPPPEARPALPLLDGTFGHMQGPEAGVPVSCPEPHVRPGLKQACGRETPVRKGDGPAGRVSMRLTERQKRMVTIASAVLGRSQQKLLSDALDAHLADLGAGELRSCSCFKESLHREPNRPD